MSQHAWRPTNARIPGQICANCGVLVHSEPPRTDHPCPGDTTVFVRFDACHELKVGEVWPDGDYPAEITAAAVISAMKGQDLLRDWNLNVDTFVSVGIGQEIRR